MAVELSHFPEMNTFSSVVRYALTLEEAGEEFYREAARRAEDKAELYEELAALHQKRYRLLEETRQQKLNEMILEPVSGLEREEYLPDLEAPERAVDYPEKAAAYEELSERFYLDVSESARELSREASKVYKRMAKENAKLHGRVAGD